MSLHASQRIHYPVVPAYKLPTIVADVACTGRQAVFHVLHESRLSETVQPTVTPDDITVIGRSVVYVVLFPFSSRVELLGRNGWKVSHENWVFVYLCMCGMMQIGGSGGTGSGVVCVWTQVCSVADTSVRCCRCRFHRCAFLVRRIPVHFTCTVGGWRFQYKPLISSMCNTIYRLDRIVMEKWS